MIRLALTVGRSMTGGGRLGNLMRRALLPRLRLVPGLRNKVVDSTTPALHSSALVHKARRARELGGTLCPNRLLPEGHRLDDVLGAGFAMIASIPPDAQAEASLRQRGITVLVVEADSALSTWLRRGSAAAAIVRPDRTVMRADSDVAALCAWTLTTIGRRSTACEPNAGRRC